MTIYYILFLDLKIGDIEMSLPKIGSEDSSLPIQKSIIFKDISLKKW